MVQYEERDRVVTKERRRGPAAETPSRADTVAVVATRANHRHLADCLVRQGYTVDTVSAEKVAEGGVDGDVPRAAIVDADACGAEVVLEKPVRKAELLGTLEAI